FNQVSGVVLPVPDKIRRETFRIDRVITQKLVDCIHLFEESCRESAQFGSKIPNREDTLNFCASARRHEIHSLWSHTTASYRSARFRLIFCHRHLTHSPKSNFRKSRFIDDLSDI